jgi:hypothetical protein
MDYLGTSILVKNFLLLEAGVIDEVDLFADDPLASSIAC